MTMDILTRLQRLNIATGAVSFALLVVLVLLHAQVSNLRNQAASSTAHERAATAAADEVVRLSSTIDELKEANQTLAAQQGTLEKQLAAAQSANAMLRTDLQKAVKDWRRQ
jgi:FtsZ-binding cell division protein ZapB